MQFSLGEGGRRMRTQNSLRWRSRAKGSIDFTACSSLRTSTVDFFDLVVMNGCPVRKPPGPGWQEPERHPLPAQPDRVVREGASGACMVPCMHEMKEETALLSGLSFLGWRKSGRDLRPLPIPSEAAEDQKLNPYSSFFLLAIRSPGDAFVHHTHKSYMLSLESVKSCQTLASALRSRAGSCAFPPQVPR
jgi:hypothetical protein